MILESVVSCLLFISYFTIKAGFLSQVETGLLLPFVIGSLALIACLMSLVLVSPHANFSVNAVSSLHFILIVLFIFSAFKHRNSITLSFASLPDKWVDS